MTGTRAPRARAAGRRLPARPERPARALLLALATLLPGLAPPAAAQEVVAARTLRPGTIVTAEDLVIRDAGTAAGGGAQAAAAEAIAALVGRETRVAIYAGRPVRPGDLGPPTLVRRNAIVVMHYRRGALSIRAEGRALAAGGAGERIRVLNLASRRPVEAVVTGPNEVEVKP